jgi:hypothetical protein
MDWSCAATGALTTFRRLSPMMLSNRIRQSVPMERPKRVAGVGRIALAPL